MNLSVNLLMHEVSASTGRMILYLDGSDEAVLAWVDALRRAAGAALRKAHGYVCSKSKSKNIFSNCYIFYFFKLNVFDNYFLKIQKRSLRNLFCKNAELLLKNPLNLVRFGQRFKKSANF